MALSYYERKARLPFGAVSHVAHEAGCALSKVSAVLSGKVRDRDVEMRLARYMKHEGRKVSVTAAFGPAAHRLPRLARAPRAAVAA
jgi:hypothetical protein